MDASTLRLALPKPTISEISPTSGTAGNSTTGTLITVTGTGFLGGSMVSVGGVDQWPATVASHTSLTFRIKTGTSTGAVVVRTMRGWATGPTLTVS